MSNSTGLEFSKLKLGSLGKAHVFDFLISLYSEILSSDKLWWIFFDVILRFWQRRLSIVALGIRAFHATVILIENIIYELFRIYFHYEFLKFVRYIYIYVYQ